MLQKNNKKYVEIAHFFCHKNVPFHREDFFKYVFFWGCGKITNKNDYDIFVTKMCHFNVDFSVIFLQG